MLYKQVRRGACRFIVIRPIMPTDRAARDAAVNTDQRECGFQRVGDFLLPRRADVPALGLVAEPDRRQPGAQRSVTPEPHPADLGKPDGAVILGETVECDVLGWQREGVVQEFLARLGKGAKTREQPMKRLLDSAAFCNA